MGSSRAIPRSLPRALTAAAMSWLAVAGVVCTLATPAGARSVRPDLPVPHGTVLATARSGNTLYLGGSFSRIGRASGAALPFDASTAAPVGLPGIVGAVLSIAPDGAGGWYVGGGFTHVGGVPRRNLAHIDSNHQVTGWDPNPDDVVEEILVSGGVVYVGGSFQAIAGEARSYLAALDAVTGQATPWNPNPNGAVRALAISGSTVYVGGGFGTIGGQSRPFLAALDATTGLATAWNPQATSVVYAIVPSGGRSGSAACSRVSAGNSATAWLRSTRRPVSLRRGTPTSTARSGRCD